MNLTTFPSDIAQANVHSKWLRHFMRRRRQANLTSKGGPRAGHPSFIKMQMFSVKFYLVDA